MTLLKNVLKICTLAALFVSANVFSADFLVDTTINDAHNDAISSPGNEWKYEVNKMDVKSVGDLVTVDIYTNFVDYNGQYSAGGRDIVFGDLLISTNGADTPFNYAFALSNGTRKYDDYDSNSHWNGKGSLTEIDSTKTAKEYHRNSSSVQEGEILAGKKIGKKTDGDVSIFRQNTGSNYNNFDVISFSFNVNGIDAFQNASQLAFSWAMSCANDIVEGVVKVNQNGNRPPNSVPEPASLLLMLLALAFMVKIRSKKSDGFSA